MEGLLCALQRESCQFMKSERVLAAWFLSSLCPHEERKEGLQLLCAAVLVSAYGATSCTPHVLGGPFSHDVLRGPAVGLCPQWPTEQSHVDVVLLGGLLLWLKQLWAVSRVPGMGDGDADVWVSL